MRMFTLKEGINLESFLKSKTINYGYAENYQERDRLEDVLKRHFDDVVVREKDNELSAIDEGENYIENCSPELIEIYIPSGYILAIVNTLEFNFSEYFEGLDEEGERI